MAYANGQLPASTLTRAANGTTVQKLEKQTAKQWAVMVAWAAHAGVTLRPEPDDGVPSCYRDLAGQRNAWAIYEKNGAPTAATPGYSNHGTGKAVDIAITATVLAWLRAHASTYGFTNTEGAAVGENWHWVNVRTVNLALPPTPAAPAATTSEEDDMALKDRIFIYKDTSHAYYERLSGGAYKKVSSSDWAVLRAASGVLKENITLIKVSAAVYKSITGK